jgi:hypothetical protein
MRGLGGYNLNAARGYLAEVKEFLPMTALNMLAEVGAAAWERQEVHPGSDKNRWSGAFVGRPEEFKR